MFSSSFNSARHVLHQHIIFLLTNNPDYAITLKIPIKQMQERKTQRKDL